jgi:2-polyprenyl-6-methoxyphenol hydroxylase-like FAD-dependent oxidoreductase
MRLASTSVRRAADANRSPQPAAGIIVTDRAIAVGCAASRRRASARRHKLLRFADHVNEFTRKLSAPLVDGASMGQYIGRHAVVVGAGIGGLAAARVLSAFFEQVTIFDRDAITGRARARNGVPQGRQLHALLAGGHVSLEAMANGFVQRLLERGAQTVRVAADMLEEMPEFDPFPRRDLGFVMYCASRPLIESVAGELCLAAPNVTLLDRETVQAIVCVDGRVRGVRTKRGFASPQLTAAELVIDASAAGELSLACLETARMPRPDVTSIGVDQGYATALFEIPPGGGDDWKACRVTPRIPTTTRGALLLPIEENRWIISIGGRASEQPPGDAQRFKAAMASLRTPTIAKAVAHTRLIGPVARFGFQESRHRHYERLTQCPLGLLPLGDAICRFNPIYGQGMSVAAQEAHALQRLLELRAREPEPLATLAPAYFARCAELIETPWELSAIPDLALRSTRGDRPPDLMRRLRVMRALFAFAAEDPEMHKLHMEVVHLLKPRSAYRTSPLAPRIDEYLARAKLG